MKKLIFISFLIYFLVTTLNAQQFTASEQGPKPAQWVVTWLNEEGRQGENLVETVVETEVRGKHSVAFLPLGYTAESDNWRHLPGMHDSKPDTTYQDWGMRVSYHDTFSAIQSFLVLDYEFDVNGLELTSAHYVEYLRSNGNWYQSVSMWFELKPLEVAQISEPTFVVRKPTKI